jgi:hypothetical protein
VYELLVYYPGELHPKARAKTDQAADALSLLSLLLAERPGFERIVVTRGGVRLFAVDCAGNRIP